MSTNVTFPPIGGSTYPVPAAGEVGWANLSNYLIALSSAQGTTSQKSAIRFATTTPVTVVSATDCVIVCKLLTPGPVSVVFPTGVNGQILSVVDGAGDAATNNITISGGDFRGSPTYVLSANFDAASFQYNAGANTWTVVSQIVSASAGSIARSAIALATPNYVVINSGTGAISEEQYLSPLRGGMGTSGAAFTGVVKAAAGSFSASTIVNADISASAAIDAAKIGAGGVTSTAYGYLAGATSNIQAQINALAPAGSYITSLTGNVTATGPGAAAATIAAGVITNAMVNASAAIAYSKLNLATSIVNADIAAGAAIAYSKLAALASGNIIVGSVGTVPTAVAMSGDVTLVASGAATIANLAVTNAKIANTTIDLTTKVTGTLPIANGGTAVTSVTTAPTATAFAGWDANSNLSSKNLIEGYSTTATAAGTTTLVVGSNYLQFFTGSTTQTVTLPVTSTLVLGQQFLIVNRSTGVVTVNSSGANAIQAMAANTTLLVTVILTSGTTAASWDSVYSASSGGSSGSGIKNYIPTAAQNSATGWTASGGGITVTTETTSSNFPDNITQTSCIKILRASGSDYAKIQWTQDQADYNWLSGILFALKYAGTAGDYTLSLYTNTASNYGGTYTAVTLPTTSIPAASTGTNFQTNGVSGGSGTQYMELRINGIAGTTPLYLNAVTFTPNPPAQGAAISEWTAWTPTLNTGVRGTNTEKAFWRRVGSEMEIQYSYTQTVAGTAGSGTYQFGLPPGYTIDSTKVNLGGVSALGNAYVASGATEYVGFTAPITSTAFNIFVYTSISAVANVGSGTAGFASNASVQYDCNVRVPIAEWSGNGTVNLGPGAQVEYVSNSSISTGSSDTTSFAYGPGGSQIQNITATLNRTIQFQYDIQPTDEITLEVSADRIKWLPVFGQVNIGAGSVVAYQQQTTTVYGLDIIQITGSKTAIVTFAQYASPGTGVYGATGQAWSVGAGACYWRVKKANPSSPVGFGLAGTDGSAGLYKAGQAPGSVTGVAIASGYVGEKITWASAPATQTITTSMADWTNASIVLTAGTWQIFASIQITISTGALLNNATFANVVITDTGNTIIQEMDKIIYISTSAAASVTTYGLLPYSFIANLSASTTYKLRAQRTDASGTGTSQILNQSTQRSQFYAVRIA